MKSVYVKVFMLRWSQRLHNRGAIITRHWICIHVNSCDTRVIFQQFVPCVRSYQINFDRSYRTVDVGNGTISRVLDEVSLWCKAHFCKRLRVVAKLHGSIDRITRAPCNISCLVGRIVATVATIHYDLLPWKLQLDWLNRA